MALALQNINFIIESPLERAFRNLPNFVQESYFDRAQEIGIEAIDLYSYEHPGLDTSHTHDILCSLNLDNYTDAVQKPLLTEGECDMAKIRMRTCIGYNDDGTSIIKQISGNNEVDLADKIVRTILTSERRHEFIDIEPIPIAPIVPSFQSYANEWMNTYKVGKCKQTTISGYNSILNGYLYPTFGEKPVNQIDVKGIQDFLNDHKEAAAKYLREMKTLLSQILECAKRDGYFSDNPAKDPRLSIPSTKKSERKALTAEQLNEILPVLSTLRDRERLYLALVIYTGMRRGEILGLRWEDIDLQHNVIHVTRNVTYTNNQPIVTTPKTTSGIRDIPIMNSLLDYLLPIREDGYIIDNRDDKDKPVTLTMFRNIFKHIEESAELDGATSHTFRHTMGTLLNDAGADVKTIQGILGQRDYKTTMDRYVHPVEKRKHEAVERVGDILSNAS